MLRVSTEQKGLCTARAPRPNEAAIVPRTPANMPRVMPYSPCIKSDTHRGGSENIYSSSSSSSSAPARPAL